MKVYLNRRPVSGPWGGGNKTVKALSDKLIKEGHEVFYDFNRTDFDIIFCVDPRPDNAGIWYQNFLNYKNQFGSKIIQRVGDLGTHSKPELFELVSQCLPQSDHIIFPSLWAKNLSKFSKNNYSIIQNRSISLFHKFKKNNIPQCPVKIVTHHWSNNPKKGFDTYSFLDNNLDNDFEFTYVGRLPLDLRFKNSNHILPLSGEELARELSEHDVYLTASKEEAGANHVLEAMACGLPVIYHDQGGSINEYVGNRGISFASNSDLITKINEVLSNFDLYKKRNIEYNDSIDQTIQEYYELICKI